MQDTLRESAHVEARFLSDGPPALGRTQTLFDARSTLETHAPAP